MFSNTTARAIDVGVSAIRPIATNNHTLRPGFANPKLVGIPTHGQGRVRPTSWLIRYDHCSSGFHSMSSIQVHRRSPPHKRAMARVHHARRHRPPRRSAVVIGVTGRDSFIMIVSGSLWRLCQHVILNKGNLAISSHHPHGGRG